MIRITLVLVGFLIFGNTLAQEIAGSQLLEKTIAHHDPNNNWKKFKGKFFVTMETPDGSDRLSKVKRVLRRHHCS